MSTSDNIALSLVCYHKVRHNYSNKQMLTNNNSYFFHK